MVTRTDVGGAVIGYARVSTDRQDAALQTDALAAAGAHRIFVDVVSGAATHRPELATAIDYLRPGDVLTVWRLDRLGRSLRDLIDQVKTIEGTGAGFRSLTESIDTTTPGGRVMFHIFGALAEFERDLIQERTKAGLAAAAAAGRHPGRPTVMTPERIETAVQLRGQDKSLDFIARTLGVGRGAVTRALEAHADREAS